MANYKDIHGTQIEVRSDNPSNPVNGQVWYNTTDQKLRGLSSNPVGSWATTGNLNQARRRLSGAGPSTTGLAISGTNDPPYFANVEQYNGSAWTEIADVTTAREETAAAGKSATSILFFGGNENTTPKHSGKTESWNGTSWSEVADLNLSRAELAGAGASNTSALTFGGIGDSPPPSRGALVESWNGTSLHLEKQQLLNHGMVLVLLKLQI